MTMRVALYSHNGYGLGHLGRNLKIARAIMQQRPSADILIITGAAGVDGFLFPDNVDYIKLPTVRKRGNGSWRPRTLDIEMEQLQRLRASIILETIRAYRPHLFIADFLPLGVDGELSHALEELAMRNDARSVIGFRDIIDDPAEVRAAWARDGIDEVVDKLYDAALVYGDPEWFDFAAYGLPTGALNYVGLLGEVGAGNHRRRSRGEARIIATAGGGADGYDVLAGALQAVPTLGRRDCPARCLAVTGPLMADADVTRLRTIAARTGGRVRRYVDDLKSKIARADAVVGMAGYNTVCEVLSFERPAVFVPRPGPSAEQSIRTRILADRGLAAVVPLAQCTGDRLVDALHASLAADAGKERFIPPLDGLKKTVDILFQLVP